MPNQKVIRNQFFGAMLKKLIIFINSRTAIAGAIIGLLLVFYNSKNLNCIGALCFFLRCVHTFFNDFDLSKRDKQVKPSGY